MGAVRSGRLLSLLWSAFGIASCLGLAYTAVGSMSPALLCRARVATACADASLEALESEPPSGPAAYRWSVRGCELGDALSCNNLGVCYQRGAGVAKSTEHARREYRKACELGNGLGCYNDASLLEDSDEPEAKLRAQRGFRRACELESAPGCRSAVRRSADLPQALSFAERGCKLEDPSTCASKALLLAVLRPQSSEARESAAALTTPCSQDEPVSCGVLGMLYAAGAPMARDLGRAEELLARACRHGSKPACDLSKKPETLQNMPELLPQIARAMVGLLPELPPAL